MAGRGVLNAEETRRARYAVAELQGLQSAVGFMGGEVKRIVGLCVSFFEVIVTGDSNAQLLGRISTSQ
jgi:hypothetical protein